MTGSSSRQKGLAPSSNNARGSLVKDFLLSGSRRLSTSALHLSVSNASGTRSHENMTTAGQTESSFIDLDPGHVNFIANENNPPGRLRTSSLTMDRSHDGKDLDSGNSSLIDSSSADSYQEFGTGSRCRTTSSSKSDQSLTSLNQQEYQIGCHRNRHSSVSDSLSGSSGKVSLNTSDITETSEECSETGRNKNKNGATARLYVYDDAHSQSESQPFLYLPHGNCFRSADKGGQYRSDSDIQDSTSLDDCDDENCDDDNCQYPTSDDADIYSSILTRNRTRHASGEPFLGTSFFNSRKKTDHSSRKFSRGADQPLLRNYDLRSKGKGRVLEVFHPEPCRVTLRRTASMSSINVIPPDSVDALSKPQTLELTSISPHPSAVYSRTSTSSATSKPPQNFSGYSTSLGLVKQNQHHHNFGSHLPPKTRDLQIIPPVYVMSSQESTGSLDPQIEYPTTQPPPQSQPQQPQHIESGVNIKLCSNHGSSTSSCNSRHGYSADPHAKGIPTYSFYPAQSFDVNPHENYINTALTSPITDSSTAATRNPVLNLESVLGHGTPVSASVLRNCLKSRRNEVEKPLQVLVPKSKMDETNQGNGTAGCLSVICPDKTYLAINGLFQERHTPKTTSGSSQSDHQCLLSSPAPSGISTSNVDTAEPSSHECSPFNVSEHNYHHRDFFGNIQEVSADHCRNLNRSEDHSKIMIQAALNVNPDHHRFESPCSHISVPSRFNPTENYPSVMPCQKHAGHLPGMFYGSCESEANSSQTNCSSPPTNQDASLLSSQVNCPLPQTSQVNCPLPQTSQVNSPSPASNQAQFERHKKSRSDSRYTTHSQVCSTEKSAFFGLLEHQVSEISPAPIQPTGRLAVNGETLQDQRPPEDRIEQTQLVNVLVGDVQEPNEDLPENNQAPADDSDFQANMILLVPRVCFVPDFFDSNEAPSETRRQSECSSLDGQQPDDAEGSLHRSNTSQLRLLKDLSQVHGHNEYLNREIPDYKFLCLAAAILNPLLGLLALICNHYARRNLHMRRPGYANKFYFATIFISTVAIFLTLIAGALLIAHKIVLHANVVNNPMTPSMAACEDMLFGDSENIQMYYKLDIMMFCEISKNEKIMLALQAYRTFDIANRNKEFSQNSSTGASLARNPIDDLAGMNSSNIQQNQTGDLAGMNSSNIHQNQTGDLAGMNSSNIQQNQTRDLAGMNSSNIQQNQTRYLAGMNSSNIHQNQTGDLAGMNSSNIQQNQTGDLAGMNSSNIQQNQTEDREILETSPLNTTSSYKNFSMDSDQIDLNTSLNSASNSDDVKPDDGASNIMSEEDPKILLDEHQQSELKEDHLADVVSEGSSVLSHNYSSIGTIMTGSTVTGNTMAESTMTGNTTTGNAITGNTMTGNIITGNGSELSDNTTQEVV